MESESENDCPLNSHVSLHVTHANTQDAPGVAGGCGLVTFNLLGWPDMGVTAACGSRGGQGGVRVQIVCRHAKWLSGTSPQHKGGCGWGQARRCDWAESRGDGRGDSLVVRGRVEMGVVRVMFGVER